jgi:hypothetical protein
MRTSYTPDEIAEDDRVHALLLENWFRSRIHVEGELQRFHYNVRNREPKCVALLDTLKLTLPNREIHNLSHSWVQKADELKAYELGSKLRCSVIIKYYVKDTVKRASLNLPADVVVVTPSALSLAKREIVAAPPIAAPAPTTAAPASGVQLLQLLGRVQEQIGHLGGVESVDSYLREYVRLGTEKVGQLHALVAELGGVEAFRQVLKYLPKSQELPRAS